jgi:hypothetical protein
LNVLSVKEEITPLLKIKDFMPAALNLKNTAAGIVKSLFIKKLNKFFLATSVAQLVEQRSPKPQVGGSSPS